MITEEARARIRRVYWSMQEGLEDDMTRAMKHGGTGFHKDWEPFKKGI